MVVVKSHEIEKLRDINLHEVSIGSCCTIKKAVTDQETLQTPPSLRIASKSHT